MHRLRNPGRPSILQLVMGDFSLCPPHVEHRPPANIRQSYRKRAIGKKPTESPPVVMTNAVRTGAVSRYVDGKLVQSD